MDAGTEQAVFSQIFEPMQKKEKVAERRKESFVCSLN
jgi:hypothetical protein